MTQGSRFHSFPRRLAGGVLVMGLAWLHLGLSVVMFSLSLMTASPDVQPLRVDGRLVALAFIDFIGAWALVYIAWRCVGRWYGLLVAALLCSIWLLPVGFIPLLGVAMCFAPVSVGGPAAVVLAAAAAAAVLRRRLAGRSPAAAL